VPTTRTRITLATLLTCTLGAACDSSGTSVPLPLPVVPCDSTVTTAAVDSFAPGDVGVYVDSSDPLLAPVSSDLGSYLGTMWGGAVPVAPGAPDGTKRLSIWISSSTAAATALGAPVTDGYALERIDASGATTLLVYAPDAADLAAGAYALLEELGARFFHPKQELVPSLGAPRVPSSLAITRTPLTHRRGLQPHTLHPIEYFDVFMQPSDANLADAKLYIDWLVKTGQNYVQWPLLSTVDWASWQPYALSIIQYAHSRGVSVGAVPELWAGSSLQNNFVLVSDPTQYAAQIQAGVDQLLTLPWDLIELTMGEFVSSDPQSTIDWLDYATDYILQQSPATLVNVENHVGNYPDLWVQYDGATEFYYHLPQFCDERLGQNVHTLSVFDLYRDWATYAHPNFFLQHDYIMEEIPTRRVSYFPESAYWISADIDVPAFLPMTIYARWLDINGLYTQLAAGNLPALDGHVTFSSGHEWGFWLTDYLIAKMLWAPGDPMESFLAGYANAFGSCSSEIESDLSTFTQLETTYLFDQRLLAYVQGEDATVDEGYIAGLETHPRRVEFEDLLTMSPADLASFQTGVVDALQAFATAAQPIEDSVAAMCRGSDATLTPWCDELWDGVEIVRLRAQHAVLLYQAVLAYVNGQDGTSYVTQAQAISATAAQVVARREPQYRFDLDRLTGQYDNPTIYAFGYLRQAHTLCYWSRREEQVTFLLQNGVPEGLLSLPSCQD
jgi:hypothetical protein